MIDQSPSTPTMSAAAGFFGQIFATGTTGGATAGAAGGAEGLFAAILGQLRAGGAGLAGGNGQAVAGGEDSAETVGEGELANLAGLVGETGIEGTDTLTPEMLAALQAALMTQMPQQTPLTPGAKMPVTGSDLLASGAATLNTPQQPALPIQELPTDGLLGDGLVGQAPPGDGLPEGLLAADGLAVDTTAQGPAIPRDASNRLARDPLFEQLARLASGQRGGAANQQASASSPVDAAGDSTASALAAEAAKTAKPAPLKPAALQPGSGHPAMTGAPLIDSHGHTGAPQGMVLQQQQQASIIADSAAAATAPAETAGQAALAQAQSGKNDAAPQTFRPADHTANALFGAGLSAGGWSGSDGDAGQGDGGEHQAWDDAELGTDSPSPNGEATRTSDSPFARQVQQAGYSSSRQPMHPASHQLSAQIQRAVADGRETLRVQLAPRELGLIDIRLEFDGGRLRAKISAERPETLEQLSKDSKQLEQALQDAGLDVDSQSLEFSLNDGGGTQARGDERQEARFGSAGSRRNRMAEPPEPAVQSYALALGQDGRVNFSV